MFPSSSRESRRLVFANCILESYHESNFPAIFFVFLLMNCAEFFIVSCLIFAAQIRALNMKNLFFILVFIFTGTTLFAQTDSTKTNTDTAGMAKIYVIRSTGHVGSTVNLRLLADDVMRCKVRNNRYAVFYVNPGTHMFNATSWDKPASKDQFGLKMPVEAGKEYYFSMRIKQKFTGIEIFLEEITYNTAGPQLQKYKQDECD